ncbi:MAG: PucR family transcriptional regulator [Actinomycetota bacterium]
MVRDLLQLPGLGLTVAAGEGGLDHPIRWVHTSELSDPTPWLSGGELLLTTGMGIGKTAAAHGAYVRRLSAAGVGGLGFGLGFGHDGIPGAILRAAERHEFPVLEVPYPVPFIAIAEAVASRLTSDRLRDAQMSVEVHERLASLVAEGAGPADLLDEVVEVAGGWALLFDLSGRVVAAAHDPALEPPEPDEVFKELPPGLLDRRGGNSSSDMGPKGTRVAFPVVAGRRNHGVLVFGKEGRLDHRARITVHHAVTVLALLLTSRRAVLDAERRVAGDILADAFADRLTGPDLERRLELIGFSPGTHATAMVVDALAPLDARALDDLVWAVDAALGPRARALRVSVMNRSVAALVVHRDPEALAGELLEELAASGLAFAHEVRVGVGETVDVRSIRRSYMSAVLALRAGRAGQRLAGPRDLGSYGLLLGGQPRPVLEGFVRSVLGPLVDRDRDRSSELVASVRAYVEAGGRWEAGAEILGIHRHTLRYRVRQAEELLGRDLSDAQDRMEVWLALKAGEILAL